MYCQPYFSLTTARRDAALTRRSTISVSTSKELRDGSAFEQVLAILQLENWDLSKGLHEKVTVGLVLHLNTHINDKAQHRLLGPPVQ